MGPFIDSAVRPLNDWDPKLTAVPHNLPPRLDLVQHTPPCSQINRTPAIHGYHEEARKGEVLLSHTAAVHGYRDIARKGRIHLNHTPAVYGYCEVARKGILLLSAPLAVHV